MRELAAGGFWRRPAQGDEYLSDRRHDHCRPFLLIRCRKGLKSIFEGGAFYGRSL